MTTTTFRTRCTSFTTRRGSRVVVSKTRRTSVASTGWTQAPAVELHVEVESASGERASWSTTCAVFAVRSECVQRGF